MVIQLDFKSPCHNIRMHFGNALIACDLYGLYLHSGHFSVSKSEEFESYFGLKNPLFMFCERDFRAVKLLNH